MQHDPVLTLYITWLLRQPRTRSEAVEEASRLGLRGEWRDWYFDNVRQ